MLTIVNEHGVLLDAMLNEIYYADGTTMTINNAQYNHDIEILNNTYDFSVYYNEDLHIYVVLYGGDEIVLNANNILDAYDEALQIVLDF